jgi:hypothetical protein
MTVSFPSNVMSFSCFKINEDGNVLGGICILVVIYLIYIYILLSGACFINQFAYGWIYPGNGL